MALAATHGHATTLHALLEYCPRASETGSTDSTGGAAAAADTARKSVIAGTHLGDGLLRIAVERSSTLLEVCTVAGNRDVLLCLLRFGGGMGSTFAQLHRLYHGPEPQPDTDHDAADAGVDETAAGAPANVEPRGSGTGYQGLKVAGRRRPQWASHFHYQQTTQAQFGGKTPLHVASYYGCRASVRVLLGPECVTALGEYMTTWGCGIPYEQFPADSRCPEDLAVAASRVLAGLDRKDRYVGSPGVCGRGVLSVSYALWFDVPQSWGNSLPLCCSRWERPHHPGAHGVGYILVCLLAWQACGRPVSRGCIWFRRHDHYAAVFSRMPSHEITSVAPAVGDADDGDSDASSALDSDAVEELDSDLVARTGRGAHRSSAPSAKPVTSLPGSLPSPLEIIDSLNQDNERPITLALRWSLPCFRAIAAVLGPAALVPNPQTGRTILHDASLVSSVAVVSEVLLLADKYAKRDPQRWGGRNHLVNVRCANSGQHPLEAFAHNTETFRVVLSHPQLDPRGLDHGGNTVLSRLVTALNEDMLRVVLRWWKDTFGPPSDFLPSRDSRGAADEPLTDGFYANAGNAENGSGTTPLDMVRNK